MNILAAIKRAIERPAETLAAWTAYFSVILIHECGHMIAAHRKGYEVLAIELYPIHGFVRFQEPWSRYDHAVIARKTKKCLVNRGNGLFLKDL